ncbi:MAG: TatD family hydrolase [Lachnospiraceae bacterium]|nr:TatD family hydrolase [Lachnospiraceae bacterium]
MIFETHAHYDDRAFDNDRDEIIPLLKQEGISPVVNVGSDIGSSERSIALAKRYDHFYAAVGVHPYDCAGLDEAAIEHLKRLCGEQRVVALGEIGLDYHYDEPGQEVQKKWFIRQLDLAKETGLPVIIHSRDAAADTFDILSRPEYRGLRGVIHCYSYSREMALKYVEMGYYIGVGGVVTFKNGRKLHETVEAIPVTSIVVETDSPYLAPVPYRGRRNSSVYLTYIIEKISQIKSLTYEETERITYENAVKLYGVRADG